MSDKCPTCERDFQGLQDYPLIYVAEFERVKLPTDLVLPFYEEIIDRPPQEVLDHFRQNKDQKSYVCNGWEWSLENEWDTGSYRRGQQNQLPIVIAKLNPYLDTLDSLVGKEVEKSQLLPNFERDGYFRYAFKIPETAYLLTFEEQGRTLAGLRITELQLKGEGPHMGGIGGATIQV